MTQQNKQDKTLTNYIRLPEKGLIASYEVAQLLAKRKRTHTGADAVIAPALAFVVETMHGTNSAEQVKKVPLLNDTISRRIEDIIVEAPGDELSLLLSFK